MRSTARSRSSWLPKQNARIDIKLEVAGQVTEVAVRSEGITPLETESAKLSDARNLQQLQTLPLAARSVCRFLVLTPGVTGGMNGTMSVSGSGLRPTFTGSRLRRAARRRRFPTVRTASPIRTCPRTSGRSGRGTT